MKNTNEAIRLPFNTSKMKTLTISPPLNLQNDILVEMDKGKVVGLIFLDLIGAFDTVNHRILESRLQLTRIGGKILQ